MTKSKGDNFMCIILFSYKAHQKYKLVLAANRDEFYKRPTLESYFWKDNPNILAGRDLEKDGTWLGITKQGRFAALTNYRDPSSTIENAESRGQLVSNYLKGELSPKDYLVNVQNSNHLYNGFNLLLGDSSNFYYYSKHNNEIIEIDGGIHGLSNHSLNTPWPKIILGKNMLKEVLEDKFTHHKLFNILRNTTKPKDEELPKTNIDLEWERKLSSIFIESPDYGSRAMTVLTIDYDNEITFIEKSLDASSKKWNESFYSFKQTSINKV